MALGSGVKITIDFRELPIYDDAPEMYRLGETTKSNPENRKMFNGMLEIMATLESHEEELLFDPQTSGGLLLSVPEGQADGLVSALKTAGVEHARLIGRASSSEVPSIIIK